MAKSLLLANEEPPVRGWGEIPTLSEGGTTSPGMGEIPTLSEGGATSPGMWEIPTLNEGGATTPGIGGNAYS